MGGRIPVQLAFPCPLDQSLSHGRMAVERRSHTNLYIRFDASDIGYDSRKVPLQMQTQSEKIRRHQDTRCASGDQAGNSSGQVGRALLKEGGLDQLESALPSH